MSFPSPLQAKAIAIAVGERIAILTGGPGTGKSRCCRTIMDDWRAKYGPKAIAALSPTGKAARRFHEVTGYGCTTIHRALARWERDATADDETADRHDHQRYEVEGAMLDDSTPLLGDLRALVIDEFSMVDQYLMARLVAIMPSRLERLLLVGDADQLPSIGPGSVLRDLAESGVVPTVRLTEIFRQSEHSWISENARRINEGTLPVADTDSEDYFHVPCETAPEAHRAIELLLRDAPEAQILTPIRRHSLGAAHLNELAREILNPDVGQAKWKAGENEFRVGDRVIHKKNNYQLGVFNGEVGTAVAVEKIELPNGNTTEALVVDYGAGAIHYTRDTAAEQLRLAFALTIHSSQGSEWKDVIVVLHSSAGYLLTRSLAYTAITRAKSRVWVVSDAKGLKYAISRNSPRERLTMLADRVAEATAEARK